MGEESIESNADRSRFKAEVQAAQPTFPRAGLPEIPTTVDVDWTFHVTGTQETPMAWMPAVVVCWNYETREKLTKELCRKVGKRGREGGGGGERKRGKRICGKKKVEQRKWKSEREREREREGGRGYGERKRGGKRIWREKKGKVVRERGGKGIGEGCVVEGERER